MYGGQTGAPCQWCGRSCTCNEFWGNSTQSTHYATSGGTIRLTPGTYASNYPSYDPVEEFKKAVEDQKLWLANLPLVAASIEVLKSPWRVPNARLSTRRRPRRRTPRQIRPIRSRPGMR